MVAALLLTVQILGGPHGGKSKVWETAANLGHDSSSTRRVSHSSVVALLLLLLLAVLWGCGSRLCRDEMGAHGLDETDRLGVSGNRKSSLYNIVAKRIHHEFSDAFGVAEFRHVHFFDTIRAALEAFLHDIGAEFLNGKETDLTNDGFTDSVDILIAADVENILDDVISVGVLHEFQTLLDDAMDQMRSRVAGRRVEASLDDTASVTMTGDIPNTRSDGIKDKLGVLVSEFEEDTLDHVVSVAVDAETSGCGGEGPGENIRGGPIGWVVGIRAVLLVEGAEFDDLLNTAGPV